MMSAPIAGQELGLQPFRGFIENQGQFQTDARFVADFDGLWVRAELGAIVVQTDVVLDDGRTSTGVVRLAFDGGESAEPAGSERVAGEFHYLQGDDPTRWRRHVPAYRDVVYASVSPGVDVRLSQRDGGFAYALLLAPSANVEDFSLRCEGVEALAVEGDGSLRMDTPLGALTQHTPVAWQVTATGEAKSATCNVRILGPQRIGFVVPDRVAGAALVIDPGLTWATFLGGSSQDRAVHVEVLSSGDVLTVGRTTSPDFPTTAGAFDTTLGGSQDIALTCFEPTGSQLVFSTLVGGSDSELAGGLAVASDGRIALGGWTKSADYPTTASAYDTSFNGGTSSSSDCCVSVLSSDGTQLLCSTFLGGSGSCLEQLWGLAFTSTDLLVVTGNSCSADFPVTSSAFDISSNGGADGFVSCLDLSQSGPSQLVYSTYVGGTASDHNVVVAVGLGDQPIVVGQTDSPDFPTTPGAFDVTPSGAFIARLSADGSSLVASTYFPGTPLGVAIEGATVVVAGFASGGLPTTPGAYDPSGHGVFKSDAFVARLDGQLSHVLAATYVGGTKSDAARSVTIDSAGRIVIVGSTDSLDYPTTPGAFDTVYGLPSSLTTSMVSYLSADLSDLLYSSFLGPASNFANWANDVAALGEADVVLVGEGVLPDFPVTPGAFDETFNGGGLGGTDGYVARMHLRVTWVDLGGAITGSVGLPKLTGGGELIGGQPLTLTLTRAKPFAPMTLIVGVSSLGLPFKGGTLVPNPTLLIAGLSANAQGTLVLPATWPLGLPSWLTFYSQAWIADSAGPAGFAASNGLSGTTP